jgi:hypothetical protein
MDRYTEVRYGVHLLVPAEEAAEPRQEHPQITEARNRAGQRADDRAKQRAEEEASRGALRARSGEARSTRRGGS